MNPQWMMAGIFLGIEITVVVLAAWWVVKHVKRAVNCAWNASSQAYQNQTKLQELEKFMIEARQQYTETEAQRQVLYQNYLEQCLDGQGMQRLNGTEVV